VTLMTDVTITVKSLLTAIAFNITYNMLDFLGLQTHDCLIHSTFLSKFCNGICLLQNVSCLFKLRKLMINCFVSWRFSSLQCQKLHLMCTMYLNQ
jgi:hypothetical protein